MAYIIVLYLWCEKEINTIKKNKKKITIIEKEIELRAKENNSYKLIIKLELNEEEAELLKKRFNLLGLSPKLNDEQDEVIETVLGNFWYKNCEINIIKQYE